MLILYMYIFLYHIHLFYNCLYIYFLEQVPRETVNGMVRTLRAFRAAYRRALVTLSCRDHRMIAVSFISFLFNEVITFHVLIFVLDFAGCAATV